MSRADEIAQGLREPGGALTFPLNCEEYGQAHEDFANGTSPPAFTSPSYDLGRARAARMADDDRQFWAWQKAEDDRRERMMRELLADRPDVLADYLAKMAEIPTPCQREK